MTVRKILVTGFAPFDNRPVNASWLAAQTLHQVSVPETEIRTQEIPVCWGQPLQVLMPIIRDWQPQMILSLGEGEPGLFKIETLARNQRRERADNDGRWPQGKPVSLQGPAEHKASFACGHLKADLLQQGIPVALSEDAGAYLCEELLYTLEQLRLSEDCLQQVLFVHLPPFGTELVYRSKTVRCDEALLADFAKTLFVTSSARAFPELAVYSSDPK